MPALEIVIVSSTGALELLRTCLRDAPRRTPTAGETLVHVVDNASTDGTPEMVRAEFPEVRLHALDWNAGFCIANNVALRRARRRPTCSCSTPTPRSTRARSTT